MWHRRSVAFKRCIQIFFLKDLALQSELLHVSRHALEVDGYAGTVEVVDLFRTNHSVFVVLLWLKFFSFVLSFIVRIKRWCAVCLRHVNVSGKLIVFRDKLSILRLLLLKLTFNDSLKAYCCISEAWWACFSTFFWALLFVFYLTSLVDWNTGRLENSAFQINLRDHLFFGRLASEIIRWFWLWFAWNLRSRRWALKNVQGRLWCKLWLQVFFAQDDKALIHAIEKAKVLTNNPAHLTA